MTISENYSLKKTTPAQVRFLQQVKATGSTSGKVKCRESVIANGWIEQDRVKRSLILFRLTDAGEAALAAAAIP